MTLTIKYDDLTGVIKHSDKLADELSEYADALSRNALQPIYSVRGGMSGNLQAAEYNLTAKIKSLQSQKDEAIYIRDKYEELREIAVETDENVASLIRENKNNFLDKYPELRPPKKDEKNPVMDFICGVGDFITGVGEAIGTFLSDPLGVITDAIGTVIDAHAALLNEIKIFWENNWKSVVAAATTFAVGVAVCVAVVLTGGLAAVAIAGAMVALTAVAMVAKDIVKNAGKPLSEAKMTAWEDYAVAGVVTLVSYSLAPAYGGTITSLTSPFLKYGLKTLTGSATEEDNPFTFGKMTEIVLEAGMSFVLDKVALTPMMKYLDDAVIPGKKIFGEGAEHLFKSQIKKIKNGITKKITFKTIKNLLVYEGTKKTIDVISDSISDRISDTVIKPHVLDRHSIFKLPVIDPTRPNRPGYQKAVTETSVKLIEYLLKEDAA
jgi:hypothetical protein